MRHAPVVRRILLRAALFLVPGSSLWALLPLIATSRLALGPGGYGVLLGALGVGAIGGALILPQIRARLSANTLVAAASLTYAAALAAVALSRSLALTIVVLLPAGVAWIAFLSNVNAALQLFLPRWVRDRGLPAYQMVLFGGQAAGAVIWGVAAGAAGLVPAFLISAVVMAAGAATIWFWPFHQIADMDRSLVRWPEPQLLISADRGSGLVLVRTAYTIAAEKEQQFLQAMAHQRQSRLRTGATGWDLYQDGQNPRLFIELFGVPSWEEHLGVTHVAMEATGIYSMPVYYALLGHGDFGKVLICNAAHVKNVPGRKTDYADAEWLAHLLECGLLAGSFIPPAEIKAARDVVRYRTKIVQQRVSEIARLGSTLQDALLTELPGVTAAQEASRLPGRSSRCPKDPDRQAVAAISPARSPQKMDIRRSTTCPASPRC